MSMGNNQNQIHVQFILNVTEHYGDEPPEAFGYVTLGEIPEVGDIIMLKWLDGSNAYQVKIIETTSLGDLHVVRVTD